MTKLLIDMSHGRIDIEGDADLVREIYADFKATLLNGAGRGRVPEAGPSVGLDETASSENGGAPVRQIQTKRSEFVDAANNAGGVTAPLPTWTTSSINAISINFRRHNYRRSSLKRYLNI